MKGVFVGRSDELGRLREAAEAAREAPVVAVVAGEPGIGKTRLLDAAAREVDLGRRFEIVGYEVEQRVPLAAAAPFIRSLSAGSDSLALDMLVGDRWDSQAPLDPVRIFEAAHRAFSSPATTLVMVDDLQWLDDLSLALVHYLIRGAETERRPLLVLAAGRNSPQLGKFAASLSLSLTGERLVELELGPLDRDQGAMLAQSLSPGLTRAAAEHLWERSAGSPFWVDALAHTTMSGREVADVVGARMRGADADAAELLMLLAIAGRPLDSAEVEGSLGWPNERVARSVAALGDRGVAIVDASGVRVAHDLIREAAAGSIPESTATRLHAALADTLERTASDNVQSLRSALEHRRAAARPGGGRGLRLSQSPRRALLGRDGLLQLAAIADEAERGPSELALQEQVATLAFDLGETDIALDRWALLGERLEAAHDRARAFLRAARAARRLDKTSEAHVLAERARTCARGDAALELRVDAFEAQLLLAARTDDPGGRALAASVAQRSRRLDADERDAQIEGLQLQFQIALYDADGERARVVADAIAEAARGFDDRTRLEALIRAGGAARLFGAFGAAESRLRPAWNEARALVLPPLVIQAAYELAGCLLRLARLEEAEAIISEANELTRRLGESTPQRTGTQRVAALIALDGGDWRDGIRRIEQVIADERDPHFHIDLHGAAATMLARVAGPAEEERILAHLDDARADAAAVGCRRCSDELLLVTAEALARLERLAEARQALAAFEPGAEWHDSPVWPFWRARAEAAVTSAAQGPAAAIPLLERVAAEASRLERHLDALWAQLDLARALAEADRTGALALLERTAGTAEASGARTVLAAAEALRRRLGVRVWRRGRGGGAAALSEREREIAALVASGASNPEIADALFLSRKTVERHVSNALAKLGARNRTELAALLARSDKEGAPR